MAEEEKSFWRDVGVGVTTSIILAALTAISALIWKFAPSAWAAITTFLAEPRYLPTWGFIILGALIVGLFLSGSYHRIEKEYERWVDVPIELLKEIQDKGMMNDLRKGRIRYKDGKIVYGDMFRRRTPVPEFENWKPTPREPMKLPMLPTLQVRPKWWVIPPWST